MSRASRSKLQPAERLAFLPDFTLEPLLNSLDRLSHRSANPTGAAAASVALIVRPTSASLELLLIKRSDRQGDPWSGHMALPGGRRDPDDVSSLATAIREAHEEVGIDLMKIGRTLGRLDDVAPRAAAPRIVVSPFVFAVPQDTDTEVNYEVQRAIWVPVDRLAAPEATTEYLHALESGESVRFPAIGYQDDVIWGLTYRILRQFIDLFLSTPEPGPG